MVLQACIRMFEVVVWSIGEHNISLYIYNIEGLCRAWTHLAHFFPTPQLILHRMDVVGLKINEALKCKKFR
jgi:hypothetical protein